MGAAAANARMEKSHGDQCGRPTAQHKVLYSTHPKYPPHNAMRKRTTLQAALPAMAGHSPGSRYSVAEYQHMGKGREAASSKLASCSPELLHNAVAGDWTGRQSASTQERSVRQSARDAIWEELVPKKNEWQWR